MASVISAANRWVAERLTSLLDLLYIEALGRFIGRETLRYAICGVINYIILDAVIYYMIYHHLICMRYIDIGFWVVSPHVASLIITFPITFLTGFWLNRYVAFRATIEPRKVQMFRYTVSVMGSIMLSYLILKVLVEVCGVWATPSKVISSVLTSLYSYLMARYFTFRSVEREKSVAEQGVCKQK